MCITHLQTLESFQLHCTISYFQDVRSEFRFFAKDITLIKKLHHTEIISGIVCYYKLLKL